MEHHGRRRRTPCLYVGEADRNRRSGNPRRVAVAEIRPGLAHSRRRRLPACLLFEVDAFLTSPCSSVRLAATPTHRYATLSISTNLLTRAQRASAHSDEPLGVVEPGSHGAHGVFAGGDSVREDRPQQRVAVDPVATGTCAAARAPRGPSISASSASRARRQRTAVTPASGACRLASDSMRTAAMRAQCGRASERPAALGTNEVARLLLCCTFACSHLLAARSLRARAFSAGPLGACGSPFRRRHDFSPFCVVIHWTQAAYVESPSS